MIFDQDTFSTIGFSEIIEKQVFNNFPRIQQLKMVLMNRQGITFILFLFLLSERIVFMLLETLLRVVNSSNFLGIHELTPDGNSYEMIYTGQIKTRKELDRVIQKYGKREVKELDTSIDEGQLIFIEVERINK